MIPEEWKKYAPQPKPLTDGNEWNVFLSYRSVNRTWVLNLYDVLTELGYIVFLDQYVLKPGDKLIKNLEAALEKTQAGVLIWSVATRDSVWVNDEYEALQQKANNDPGFIFVPVTIDNTKLPTFAANRIYVDFTSYPDGPNGGDLLRLLYALVGQPLPANAVHFANEQNDAASDAMAQIKAAVMNGDTASLLQLFEEGGLPWKTTAALGCMAAEGLIKLKDNDNVIKILEQLEINFSKALRPRQLKGLALARRGKGKDLDEARKILGFLYAKNNLDPETMGIYARTWMDKYAETKKSGTPDINYLIKSRDIYAEAFDKAPDDYYTGINAAAKSVLIGLPEDLAAAKTCAERVQKITGSVAVAGDYWKTATIAEVLLMQSKYEAAGKMYKKAVSINLTEIASHETTWKQACRLMEKLKPTAEEKEMVLEAFKHLPGYKNFSE